ncbi:MAG TPA: carboxypeptidase-like regulatory domain-containing protein [Clostridia bacterium]
MDKSRINLVFNIFFCCLITCVATILIMNSVYNRPAFSQNEYGYLKIRVIDLVTREPVAGATVCIVESNQYYTTDKNGFTPTIQAPYLKNTNFDNVLERPWGDITILAYKEGYVDYLVFYIMLPKNATRHLTITLAPYSAGAEPYLLIESPDDEWAKEIIKKYKK